MTSPVLKQIYIVPMLDQKEDKNLMVNEMVEEELEPV